MIPPGQKIRTDFPRFGLPDYAQRFPSNIDNRSITIHVNGTRQIDIADAFTGLTRITIQADFHCVTTWSYPNAEWSGVKFSAFFQKYIKPLETAKNPIVAVVLYAQDGYRTSLLLDDLLQESVILADSLNGQSLSIEHGAPIRMIAPEHYGYKNVKHLTKLEFHSTMPVIKRGISAFLDHPRARVRKEERGRWIPGWILRYLYRQLIPGTVKDFHNAMIKHKVNKNL